MAGHPLDPQPLRVRVHLEEKGRAVAGDGEVEVPGRQVEGREEGAQAALEIRIEVDQPVRQGLGPLAPVRFVWGKRRGVDLAGDGGVGQDGQAPVAAFVHRLLDQQLGALAWLEAGGERPGVEPAAPEQPLDPGAVRPGVGGGGVQRLDHHALLAAQEGRQRVRVVGHQRLRHGEPVAAGQLELQQFVSRPLEVGRMAQREQVARQRFGGETECVPRFRLGDLARRREGQLQVVVAFDRTTPVDGRDRLGRVVPTVGEQAARGEDGVTPEPRVERVHRINEALPQRAGRHPVARHAQGLQLPDHGGAVFIIGQGNNQDHGPTNIAGRHRAPQALCSPRGVGSGEQLPGGGASLELGAIFAPLAFGSSFQVSLLTKPAAQSSASSSFAIDDAPRR